MKKTTFFTLLFFCANFLLVAQEKTAAPVDTFQFSVVKELPITPVKNQASSGTCWSYSGLALFESEILRLGKPEVDLAEMFVVHHSYADQAEKFVRMGGTINFSAGGSFYDVLYVLKHYGIVPQAEMEGLNYGEEKNRHGELDAILSAYVKAVILNKNKKLSTAWKTAYDRVLDTYLGECPKEFKVAGKTYTPKTYAASLGLNFDDYVSLTSYTHHPFYEQFVLEIADNWRWASSYNLPIDELMEVFDNAINKGYTYAWASDVSEKGFTRNGIGVNPETNVDNLPGSDQSRWVGVSQRDREKEIFKLEGPQPEMKVTQEMRQIAYDNYETTDDHGMLIYGIAKDQNNTKYYMVKNSWGTENKYNGIWYVSESFAKYKTMNIMVHKNAIPKHIRKKMGL